MPSFRLLLTTFAVSTILLTSAAQAQEPVRGATNADSRRFGTLGVLRHALRDRNARLMLCQFKPEHDLNPDTLARYAKNRLRVVPELVYSPWASDAHLAETGARAKAWRIDLVLFVNGLPVATLELKSEFKQSVERAIRQNPDFQYSPLLRVPSAARISRNGSPVRACATSWRPACTRRAVVSPSAERSASAAAQASRSSSAPSVPSAPSRTAASSAAPGIGNGVRNTASLRNARMPV